MHIYLSGSSGLVGSALTIKLEADGHQVTPLGRDFSSPISFSGVDAVIHLAGENIAEGRWNKRKKARIRDSRVINTRQLCERISESVDKPSIFISASATGFYGDRADEQLSENSLPGEGFLPEVCQEWEQATEPLANLPIRVAHIRTGIVLSRKGGALKKMLPPFLFGGGGILGSGDQYMSWISLEDEIRAISYVLHHETLQGAINLTAPEPVDNHEFTKILGHVLKRPTIAPLPAPIARILFGEMADAILLSGSRVFPKKLLSAGFTFAHPELEIALRSVLKKNN